MNITKFNSCDIPGEPTNHLVYLRDITYDIDSAGYCDTVHAKYRIPTVNIAEKVVNK